MQAQISSFPARPPALGIQKLYLPWFSQIKAWVRRDVQLMFISTELLTNILSINFTRFLNFCKDVFQILLD